MLVVHRQGSFHDFCNVKNQFDLFACIRTYKGFDFLSVYCSLQIQVNSLYMYIIIQTVDLDLEQTEIEMYRPPLTRSQIDTYNVIRTRVSNVTHVCDNQYVKFRHPTRVPFHPRSEDSNSIHGTAASSRTKRKAIEKSANYTSPSLLVAL